MLREPSLREGGFTWLGGEVCLLGAQAEGVPGGHSGGAAGELNLP